MDLKLKEWVGFLVSVAVLLAYAWFAVADMAMAWNPPKPACERTAGKTCEPADKPKPLASQEAPKPDATGAAPAVQEKPPTPANAKEWKQYVWTTVSVFIGSVVAIALGVPKPRFAIDAPSREGVVLAYTGFYLLVGLAMVVTVTAKFETALETTRAGAATFIGFVIPIAAQYLQVQKARAALRTNA